MGNRTGQGKEFDSNGHLIYEGGFFYADYMMETVPYLTGKPDMWYFREIFVMVKLLSCPQKQLLL